MRGFLAILQRLKRYRKNLILVILFNILYSVFTVVSIPLLIPFFRLLFDRNKETPAIESNMLLDYINTFYTNIIETQGKEAALLQVCLVIIALFFLKNISRYLASYFIVPIRVGFVTDLRHDLYKKYVSLPYLKYPSLRTGDLISRITADIQEVEGSILKVIEVIFKSPIVIIGSIIFLVYTSPQLTLFVLVLLLFTVFIIGSISKTLKRQSSKAQGLLGKTTNQVEETIASIKVIKAYGVEDQGIKSFDDLNHDYRKTMTALMRRNDLSSPMSEFLGVCVVMTLMWYGAQLVFDLKLEPDTFFAFIVAFYQVIEPSKSLSTAYYSIQKGMAAFDRVADHLALEEETLDHDIEPIHIEDRLKIQNLSYQYPTGSKVLDNISLDIAKGETVAIIGASGSGKTTLVDIISGIIPPQEGSITLDGMAYAKYSLSQWRSLFGIVTQSPVLFHDTVRGNITLGKTVDDRALQEACEVAYASEFIQHLPKGMDTVIGEKGMKLSGGQRQRLTIARAILASADILILDEATSALDSESEKNVQKALELVTKDKTSIVIAHRLSTIKNADKIILLEHGKIVAQGTHDQLLETNTTYAEMIRMQNFEKSESL